MVHRILALIVVLGTLLVGAAAIATCMHEREAEGFPSSGGTAWWYLPSTSPVLNPAWSTAQWFVDPSNASGCASDANTGTCGGCNTCGNHFSGDGPLLTWHELNDHRWACLAGAAACPRIQQSTNVQFLSGHPASSTDVVRFYGAIESGSTLILSGAFPTPTGSGTITGPMRAVNRANGFLLQATALPAGCAVGNFVVNATRASSRAWIYSGTGPVILSQPLGLASIATQVPAENTAWSAGDAVSCYALLQVNIATLLPVVDSIANSTVALQNIMVPAFTSQGGTDALIVNTAVTVLESGSPTTNPKWLWLQPGSAGQSNTVTNGFWPTVINASSANQGTLFVGGVLGTQGGVQSSGVIDIMSDAIIAGSSSWATGEGVGNDFLTDAGPSSTIFSNASGVGSVYLASGVTANVVGGGTFCLAAAACSGVLSNNPGVLWGPGTINFASNSRTSYVGGSNAWSSVMLLTDAGGTAQINSLATGCATAVDAGPVCNLAFTTANIDTSVSPFPGKCFATGAGASICASGGP